MELRPSPDAVPGPPVTSRSDLEALAGSALFADVPPDVTRAVMACAEVVTVHGREWLMRAGEPADSLYIVRRGRLHVVDEEAPPGSVLRVLSGGDVVGEMGVL